MLVGTRIEARSGIEKDAIELASSEADIIHLLYDEQGQESRDQRWPRTRCWRSTTHWPPHPCRERVSIIAAGGLAAAEHVPKSLICGADAVVLEQALKVALGCHACPSCPRSCPMDQNGITTN